MIPISTPDPYGYADGGGYDPNGDRFGLAIVTLAVCAAMGLAMGLVRLLF